MQWHEALVAAVKVGRGVILLTVIDRSGSAPRSPGAKMIVTPEGEIVHGTIGGGHLELDAIQEAVRLARSAVPGAFVKKYALGPSMGQCCGGTVEVLFEAVGFRPRVWVFGAGHVGTELAEVLRGGPFDLTLVDERDDRIARLGSRAPSLRAVRQNPLDFLAGIEGWDSGWDHAVIMTHSHDLDFDLIEALLRKVSVEAGHGDGGRPFIGLIGSRGKWERFRQRLAARDWSEAALALVTCPVGLGASGADLSPREIAIGIAAQLVERHNLRKRVDAKPR